MLQEVSNKAPANLQTLAKAVHSLQGGYNLNCSWVIHTHTSRKPMQSRNALTQFIYSGL